MRVDRIFAIGDYNSEPGFTVHRMMREEGFTSAYEKVHGEEPEFTYHGGLDSEYADPDLPCCLDYMYFKGSDVEVTQAKLVGQ